MAFWKYCSCREAFNAPKFWIKHLSDNPTHRGVNKTEWQKLLSKTAPKAVPRHVYRKVSEPNNVERASITIDAGLQPMRANSSDDVAELRELK